MTELMEKLGIRSRHGVEAFIERLIDTLYEMDPDPDLEDDELEAVNEDGSDMLEEADCGHGRLQFRGDGNREAEQMLSELLEKPVPPPVKPIYDEKVERLSDGTIFRTPRQVNFIPSRSVDGGKS